MSKKAKQILEFISVNSGAPLSTIYFGIKHQDILLFDWHIKQYLKALCSAGKIEIKDNRVFFLDNNCNNIMNKEKEKVKELTLAPSGGSLTHSQKEDLHDNTETD